MTETKPKWQSFNLSIPDKTLTLDGMNNELKTICKTLWDPSCISSELHGIATFPKYLTNSPDRSKHPKASHCSCDACNCEATKALGRLKGKQKGQMASVVGSFWKAVPAQCSILEHTIPKHDWQWFASRNGLHDIHRDIYVWLKAPPYVVHLALSNSKGRLEEKIFRHLRGCQHCSIKAWPETL